MDQYPQYPMPTIKRAMVFIDGENLVQRFQDMKEAGCVPHSNTDLKHIPDVFVWTSNTFMPQCHTIIRATYYTYTQGDPAQVLQVASQIREMGFMQYRPPKMAVIAGTNHLYPSVFWKGKGKKAKGVDIQMTVDILTNVHQNNLDSVYLISGDGDYKPVILECIRCGKVVYVGALSSGLNPELPLMADQFVSLDDHYFASHP